MDFGKVPPNELDSIDFTLPPDPPGNERIFRAGKGNTRIRVGCAKWGIKEWVGTLFPEETKEADFLEHYARHFDCVELNATFYKLPSVKQARLWKSKVGADFKFCPKFSNKITHIKRLKDAQEFTRRFVDGVTAFGENLGPSFIQTPPNFATRNFDVLATFLEELPRTFEVFVELRHPGWYSDQTLMNQVFDLLERLGVGAVITDAAGRRDCVHMRVTTPGTFIRFVGNNLHASDYHRADAWLERIRQWKEKGIEDVYLFMHQHEEVHSPVLCRYLKEKLN